MEPLFAWLRSLSSAGAADNAAAVLQERQREEWIVDSLVLRLERNAQPTTAPAKIHAAI